MQKLIRLHLIAKAIIFHPKRILKGIILLANPKKLFFKIRQFSQYSIYASRIDQQFQQWLKKNYPDEDLTNKQRKLCQKFKFRPLISILTPTYNTRPDLLRDCIESVLAQSYDNWEFCIADDASPNSEVRETIEEYAKKDSRIKFVFREKNGHISAASNSALKICSGEFVALLDHDDFLWPNALFEVVSRLQSEKNVDFIYTDEDKIEENGRTHSDCFFKPDFSPDYLRSCNYITHFAVIRRKLLEKVGGFRTEYDGTQDWDLFLRISREIGMTPEDHKRILHIPKILYSWRKSETSAASEKVAVAVKGYAFLNQRKALEIDLKNSQYKGEITSLPYLSYWRVKYDLLHKPLVSIIIIDNKTENNLHKSLKSIFDKSNYKNFEVLVVTKRSKDEVLKKNKYSSKINVLTVKQISQCGEMFNQGSKLSKGDYLVFFESGIKVLNNDWIEALLEHSQRKEIGVVSGKTIFTNGTVCHAGVLVGTDGKIIFGMDGFFDKTPQSYPMVFSKDVVRNMLAFAPKVVMVRKIVYQEIGGFDTEFEDDNYMIDFCFKVYYSKNFYNLFTPFSTFEIERNDSLFDVSGKDLLIKKWSNKFNKDPFYNENLTLVKNDFSLKI